MKLLCLLAVGLTGIVFISCGDVKKLQYLQGPLDASKYSQVNYTVPVIQAGDVISIKVFSESVEASAPYNQVAAASGVASGTQSTAEGFLVDNNGFIRFYTMGNVLVKGLTCDQVATLLATKLKEANLLTNPYCQVRFNNFKFTILGEVNHPSVFSAPNEKISVLEALGLAGDLSPYGRRDSVLVIREFENQRKFGWLDLRSPSIFNSEYFFLKQNDVVVVHPNKSKAASNDQIVARNIGLTATIVSTIAILYSVFKK